MSYLLVIFGDVLTFGDCAFNYHAVCLLSQPFMGLFCSFRLLILSWLPFADAYSHVVACLFTFFMVSFDEYMLMILTIQFTSQSYSIQNVLFVLYSRNLSAL